MKNDWRDIEGFEGLYQINSESVVRSVDRYVTQLSNNGNLYSRIHKGKVRKPFVNKSGYLMVGLSKEGETFRRSVHRLLYLTFNNIKNIEAEGLDINHIDHNKLNNKLDNLELVTRSENIKSMVEFYDKSKKIKYCECGSVIYSNKAAHCVTCSNLKNRKVKVRPTKESLMEELSKSNFVQVGKKYGVSDNTIRYWLRKY